MLALDLIPTCYADFMASCPKLPSVFVGGNDDELVVVVSIASASSACTVLVITSVHRWRETQYSLSSIDFNASVPATWLDQTLFDASRQLLVPEDPMSEVSVLDDVCLGSPFCNQQSKG